MHLPIAVQGARVACRFIAVHVIDTNYGAHSARKDAGAAKILEVQPLTGDVFATDPLGNNAYIAAVLTQKDDVCQLKWKESEKLKLGSAKLPE